MASRGTKNCDASKPTATWSTGNNSMVLNTTGHYYFLYGVTGHCATGQKVGIDINGRPPTPNVTTDGDEPPVGGGVIEGKQVPDGAALEL
ncbi:hypothetical protein PR202_ga29495 [Eleusine coracana subsp. coracana]|uniref:Phytocyanin domain-containing protein n=1 Tax=Eleusine coracana subsp. coracana TaxID=191504 RepID=A0AAV5DLR6_ELECO|nr:hypothetical protein PR202_ga29495 [Eleusine coracana subsp. coracana]